MVLATAPIPQLRRESGFRFGMGPIKTASPLIEPHCRFSAELVERM
jgi:hypothetical protein